MTAKKKDFSDLTPGYEGVGTFYDLFADNSDIPFYVEYARTMGSPILDLAAGTGRVSLALAHEGFEVIALECSPSMLTAFRKKLQQTPPIVSSRITLVEGDMRRFELPQRFSLIIIPNSFGHAMTRKAQMETLRCVLKHMREDGMFILDLYAGEMQYTYAKFEDPSINIGNGKTVERHGEIHSDRNRKLLRVDLHYIVRNTDGSIVETVEVTSGAALIFKRDVDLLLRDSGLEIFAEVGGFDHSPCTDENDRRVLLLKKKKLE